MMGQTEQKACKADVKICTMTFNVESAREADRGRERKLTKAGRLANNWRGPLLRKQLEQHGVHLIGIQEGRNEKRCASKNGYYTISSAHENYNYGCELWASLTEPYAITKSGPVYFDPNNFHVLVS